MKTSLSTSWSLRLITLGVWLLVMLCGVYWAMKFVKVKPVSAAFAAAAPAVALDTQAIARLLGASNSVADKSIMTPASSNYVLFGLAMEKAGGGVALIATDGKPAKPYRVGSLVAGEWVLKSVSRTEAILATSVSAPDGIKLDLPLRQAATGIIGMAPAGGRVQIPVPAQLPQVQPQIPSASSFVPAAPPAAGLGSTMANVANPTALTPTQTDALAQRPVSRFAPGQSDQGTRARIPLTPPASFTAPVDGQTVRQ